MWPGVVVPGARDGLVSGGWGRGCRGVPPGGSTSSLQLTHVWGRLAHPAPTFPECPRTTSRGSREGAGECLHRAEGPRVEEAGVSLSSARPLSRLGKVGRGRVGISALGEGTPRQSRGRGLCMDSREGVCPQYIETRTHASRGPRSLALGRVLEPLEVERRGAGLRPPPSPGFGRSANPAVPLAPPGPREISTRRQRPFRKVCTAAGWSSGPPGARSRPCFSLDLSRDGAGPGVLALARDFRERPLAARNAPAVDPGGWYSRPAPQPHTSRASPSRLRRHKEPPSRSGHVGRQRGFRGAGRRQLPGPRQGEGEVSEWAEGPFLRGGEFQARRST